MTIYLIAYANQTNERKWMTKKISNAERVVMKAFWERSPLSAQEVIEVISPQKDWQAKTVKTLLNRLLKKEILAFKKEQRKYLYYPLLSRKTYLQLESRKFLENWFGDKVSHQLLVSFAAKELLSKQEIEELKKLLDEMD
jgi:BlaI family penicillinase repressor